MKVVHPGLEREAGVATPTNPDRSARMNIHQHARLTPQGRALMVGRILNGGWRVADAAAAAGLSERRAYEWLRRSRAGGADALRDRRSTPACFPRALPARTVAAIERLRHERLRHERLRHERLRHERLRHERLTGDVIAQRLGLKRSTVGATLRRLGLGRLAALEPRPPAVRYQREHPGGLVHVDAKKLGRIVRPSHRVTGDRRDAVRGAGWDYVHVAVDDAPRLAYTEAMASERKEDAAAFLARALAFLAAHGVTVERVMTDNGSAYRGHLFRDRLGSAGCRHLRTRPHTPGTNGKAERFIQTSLRGWAHARTYQTSAERTLAMQPWITRYNQARPHSALGGHPPVTRLNNVPGFDS
jgi:transposase InsO family protein